MSQHFWLMFSFGIHQDPQILPCKSAFQPCGLQHELMHGFTPQGQNLAFPSLEFSETLVGIPANSCPKKGSFSFPRSSGLQQTITRILLASLPLLLTYKLWAGSSSVSRQSSMYSLAFLLRQKSESSRLPWWDFPFSNLTGTVSASFPAPSGCFHSKRYKISKKTQLSLSHHLCCCAVS